MSEPRLCCNCLHCARWRKKDGIECHCDLNDKYLGYLTVMDEENDCKHWEKETKWDLQREHDAKVRADAINNFVIDAITEFQKFDKEHGYPTLGDISVILSDVAEGLKWQNNE